MNGPRSMIPQSSAVINALAGAGFIALIGGSMWLAVYSTRYVPDVVTRLSSAAVYLGSVFTPSPTSLSVVPTPEAPTIISFGETPSITPAKTPTKPVTTPGNTTNTTVQIAGANAVAPLSGLPDLIVSINAIGYLATTSAESFVATSTVSSGGRPAVKFTIKNIGTNITGQWRFSASIPTQSSYLYQSQPQQSLAPGDSIDYTLGFDQAIPGSNQTISINANFDRTISESNTNNNGASAALTILGS